jgi:hypothetical protein
VTASLAEPAGQASPCGQAKREVRPDCSCAPNDKGVVFSFGAAIRGGRIILLPEFRFTNWTGHDERRNRKQGELLLTFRF